MQGPVMNRSRTRTAAFFLTFGCVVGFLSVAAGAFGAHALRDLVTESRLEVFHTGTRYAQVHAVVLLVVGLLVEQRGGRALTVAGAAFSGGILIFTGSLWTLVLADMGVLGAITPLGGVGLLVGWFSLGLALWRAPASDGGQGA